MGARTPCTIGIAARNEEASLGSALESLDNDLLHIDRRINVVVAANGCSDRTVDVALNYAARRWGAPRKAESVGERCWRFESGQLRFDVLELVIARKSAALNAIHSAASSGIVILLDGDITLPPRFVNRICATFDQDPTALAVSPRYCGEIPLWSAKRGRVRETLRVALCRAFNHFDERKPRLDGKAFAYRHELISMHPGIIAVDLWLEGQAARRMGCRYVDDLFVSYRFPAELADLVAQYRRFEGSIRALERRDPGTLTDVRRARAPYTGKKPNFRHRVIAWLFLRVICGSVSAPADRYEDEAWNPVCSTKRSL